MNTYQITVGQGVVGPDGETTFWYRIDLYRDGYAQGCVDSGTYFPAKYLALECAQRFIDKQPHPLRLMVVKDA